MQFVVAIYTGTVVEREIVMLRLMIFDDFTLLVIANIIIRRTADECSKGVLITRKRIYCLLVNDSKWSLITIENFSGSPINNSTQTGIEAVSNIDHAIIKPVALIRIAIEGQAVNFSANRDCPALSNS